MPTINVSEEAHLEIMHQKHKMEEVAREIVSIVEVVDRLLDI